MQTLGLFIYRKLSVPTFESVLQLLRSPCANQWQIKTETGDALISRARSTLASQWLRESDADVLVMCDDDFYFTPDGLEALVSLAREKRSIVAGVTPLRSGEYTAIVPLERRSDSPLAFRREWDHIDDSAQEIKWAGGLIAYHRDVFETLTHTLPLLHKDDRIPAFWPFFAPAFLQDHGNDIYLSEDYACHERARKAGFTLWVQPACQVAHEAELLVSSGNMHLVRDVFTDPTLGGTYGPSKQLSTV